MLLTTSPEVTTPLVKKSSISVSTESESLLTNVPVFKVSSFSTPSVVVPDPVSVLSSLRDFPSITVRSPSSVSPSTHPHRSPPLLLSHTTPSCPPTLSSSTLTSPSCSTTRLSTISAEEPSILRDQPTPTSTDSSLRLSPPLPLPSDSTVPLTSISLSSRPTWCPTPESTSCSLPMLQSSPPRRLTTSSSPLLRSPTAPSSPPPGWPSVTQDTESTWFAASCTEVMSSPRMSTLPSPPSRPREPSSSSTGAQPDSSAVSTTSHQPLCQVVISPRS